MKKIQTSVPHPRMCAFKGAYPLCGRNMPCGVGIHSKQNLHLVNCKECLSSWDYIEANLEVDNITNPKG